MIIIERNFITVRIPAELTKQAIEKKAYCGLSNYLSIQRLHHIARCYGFYLLLKAESPGSSVIQNYTRQIATLSRKYCLPEDSFFYYLEKIEKMKLAFREGSKLKLASWDQLARHLHIHTNEKFIVEIDYSFPPVDILIYQFSLITYSHFKIKHNEPDHDYKR